MDFTTAFDKLNKLNEDRQRTTLYQHYDRTGRVDAEAESPKELAVILQTWPEFRGKSLGSISNTIRHGLLKDRPEWGKLVIYEETDDSIVPSEEEEEFWDRKGEEESKLNFRNRW